MTAALGETWWVACPYTEDIGGSSPSAPTTKTRRNTEDRGVLEVIGACSVE